MQRPVGLTKKHKKHKKDKHDEKSLNGERPTALKLILKVGSSSTPEHSDSPGPVASSSYVAGDDESIQSSSSLHKKSKKKKKKKDKDHDKHERKKKHHHKDKKKKYEDQSSEDGMSVGEDTMIEAPLNNEYSSALKQDNSTSLESHSGREPRLCVQLLRQKQNRSPLIRTLEYLQRQLEKKDPQQFFAWPVTDQIAPGYSKTISHPMDFSTMRQKVEDNAYTTLNEYITDLKLMCNNAMTYNQADTIYYKAAKRLLHGGLKMLSPEKIKQLSTSLKWISEIPPEQLGFQIRAGQPVRETPVAVSPKKATEPEESTSSGGCKSPKRKAPEHNVAESKFEAISDDMTPEQILEQSQKALLFTHDKLSLKKPKTNMGFVRQQADGTTSLAILIPNSGDPDNPTEKPVSLGQLIGKLSHGSGQLHGMREDRRNVAKTVRPLNYGAFGSYAPSYDSTFANLSKEESDLIYETYGDENATLYAESILNFAKDCNYTLTMVDNLLDLLTGGEHRKAISVIDEQRKFREEEERVKDLMESKEVPNAADSDQSTKKADVPNVKIEVEQLKTLSELGIDVSFLNDIGDVTDAAPPPPPNPVQEKLEHTTALIEKLHQVQNDRLSAPPPAHLSHIMPPSETEINLAEKITESLTELAKQVPPGALIPVPAIRKAMGIVNETMSVSTSTNTTSPLPSSVGGVVDLDGGDSSGEDEPCVGVGQLDLESELREFLESDTALSNFPLHDDKTIEEMLSES